MNKFEWMKATWAKALAFLLAAACVPAICVSAFAIACAYENGWWVGTPDLYETSFVRSEVWAQMQAVLDVYRYHPGGSDEWSERSWWTADPSQTNYRFTLTDADGSVLFDNTASGDHVYYDIMDYIDYDELKENGAGRQIRSAVAAQPLGAQDNIYWALSAANNLYAWSNLSIPLLFMSIALFLLLSVYLAFAAGRHVGTEGASAGWQERIPFDLYLSALFCGMCVLFLIFDEAGHFRSVFAAPYLVFLCMLIYAAAALLLAGWMTFCTRVKLGGWWRNTLTYRALQLFWRFLLWCRRVLYAVWRGMLTVFKSIPMMWRTTLALGAVFLYDFICIFLFRRDVDMLLFTWLIGKAAVAFAVAACVLQLRKLQAGGEALAAGNLDAKVDTAHMLPDLRRHGENLNSISAGMQHAVDRQLSSECLKTELITNVSHDIKTPLTSIVNYVDLLRHDPAPEQAAEYLDVLDRQSRRLKKLTEDLVEMSKATTGNLPVNASRRSVSELLLQAVGEYSEKMDKAGLETVLSLPEQECFAFVDGTLLWRVLDNVFSNACKYALRGTRFYISAAERGGRLLLSFKNISRDQLNISADELMERFVRGDSSRAGEGSGLGLNIARSLTELQGGTFELCVDGDLFRVDISFPAAQS